MDRHSLLGHVFELHDLIRSTRTPPDKVARDFFRSRHYLGARDRRFIAETLYGMLRHQRLLLSLLDPAGDMCSSLNLAPQHRGVALYAAYALRVVNEDAEQVVSDIVGLPRRYKPGFDVPAFVDALLTSTLPPQVEGNAVHRIAVIHSFPDFVVEEWVRRFGTSRAEALCEALNRPAPTTIRVNTLRTSVEECREALKREGIEARQAELSPSGLLLEKRINALALESFRQGWFEVQDEASQLIALLVRPKEGESVVDACAGGGGKTLHLAALMNNAGSLLSVDIEDGRLRRIRERTGRAGVTIVRTCHAQRDASLLRGWEGRADRVLVDAPCTGLGTARRNPWLKLSLTETDVDRLAEAQRTILDRYARLVKPGGWLVYATCTLLEKENEEAVERFLKTHTDFSLLSAPDLLRELGVPLTSSSSYLQLLPSETQTDGFFAAALLRST
jgi:16S rRNA (cytosine967-C5)-methyltransferase